MSIDHKRSTGVSSAEKIGDYVRYQRMKRGYSLNEFAKLAKLTTSFLLRLERGEYKNVKFVIIEKLAAGFKIPLDDFLIKCQIIPSHSKLYSLDYFFKELYQFPEAAVKDLKLFIQLLEVKYKDEIKKQKIAHKLYWQKKR